MDYTLIRARKRTLSLQVGKGGEVIARAPLLMPKFLIDRFVEQKSAWLQKRIIELQKPELPKKEHFTVEDLKLYIESELNKYGKIMGLHFTGLRYSQVNSYWGTCSPTGVLSFNLALRYVTKDAVSYVVVHELSHLRWRGHGKRFWDMVERYYPRTKAMRAYLRKIPRFTI